MLWVFGEHARTKKIELFDNGLHTNPVSTEIGRRKRFETLMLTSEFLRLTDVTFVPGGVNHREARLERKTQHRPEPEILMGDWMMRHAIADG